MFVIDDDEAAMHAVGIVTQMALRWFIRLEPVPIPTPSAMPAEST